MPAYPTAEEAQRADLQSLLRLPAFRRFLFRIVESSGICASTYGTEGHLLYREGARSLGLDILRWVSDAHPVQEHTGVPVNVLLTILAEANLTDPATKEMKNGRRNRHDRNAELDGDADSGDGRAD